MYVKLFFSFSASSLPTNMAESSPPYIFNIHPPIAFFKVVCTITFNFHWYSDQLLLILHILSRILSAWNNIPGVPCVKSLHPVQHQVYKVSYSFSNSQGHTNALFTIGIYQLYLRGCLLLISTFQNISYRKASI